MQLRSVMLLGRIENWPGVEAVAQLGVEVGLPDGTVVIDLLVVQLPPHQPRVTRCLWAVGAGLDAVSRAKQCQDRRIW